MQWYYAAEGKEAGPLEEQEFDELVQAGSIRPETLVWNATLTDWKPLSQVSPEKLAVPATTPPPLPASAPRMPVFAAMDDDEASGVCAECARIFPVADLVLLTGETVCAGCQPGAVAKIREGLVIGTRWFPAILSKRTTAFLIDFFMVGIVSTALQQGLTLVVTLLSLDLVWITVIVVAVGFLVTPAYFIFFWTKFGATPGKMTFGIRILTYEYQPLTWKRATIRWLGTIASSLLMMIGYLMAFVDDERRTLHDRMAQTLVVQKP